MKTSTLLLATFMVFVQKEVSSLPYYKPEEDIKNNFLEPSYDSIEGLNPPEVEAEDFYKPKSISNEGASYVVEISRKYVKFQTTGFPVQSIRLLDNETEAIQKVSLGFVELLNNSKLSYGEEEEGGGEGGEEVDAPDWRTVNPVFTLTSSGISLRFLNSPEKENEEGEKTSGSERTIVWNFLTKYAENIFEEKTKGLNVTVDEGDVPVDFSDSDSPDFENFVKSLWKIMKLSLGYAEENFNGWTTSFPETTETDVEGETTRQTTATLFAFEEPFPVHVFPSEEFEKRRRDIDSIFYGRGII